MVVFLNVADLDDPDLTILQANRSRHADSIAAVDNRSPRRDGVLVCAALLRYRRVCQSEIGRLFGIAFLIIVLILMFVYLGASQGQDDQARCRYADRSPTWG